jgi:MFS family permease
MVDQGDRLILDICRKFTLFPFHNMRAFSGGEDIAVIKNTKAITISAFLSMFFLGVGTTIVGAAARNIGLTPYQIGLLISILNLGFMMSVVVSGALSDTHEKPRILFIGSLLLALSFFVFYIHHSFLLNLLIMFVIGIGMGTYEGVTDAMLLDIHEERQSLYINANHFFVTFGALIITLYLIFLQMNWRRSVTQSAAAVLLLAIFFALTKLENEKRSSEKLSDRVNFLRQQKKVKILFFAAICAIGLEMGSMVIMTTFLMELRGFSQVTSKVGLVLFLSGIGAGRLFAGFFTKKDQILRNIILLFGLSTLFTGIVYLMDISASGSILGYIITYAIIFVSGMTLSALLPLIITLAGLIYKDMSGTVLGIIKIAIPLGGIFVPFFISIISKYISFGLSLLIFPFIALASFIVLLTNKKAFC